ncbi:neprilysin-1-like [Haemaphysalis longicornis]
MGDNAGPRIVPDEETEVQQDPPFGGMPIGMGMARAVPEAQQHEAAPHSYRYHPTRSFGRGAVYTPYQTDSRVNALQLQIRCVQVILVLLIITAVITGMFCWMYLYGCLNPPAFPSIYMINETTSCISDGCKDFVARFSETVLPMVSPCDDFYEHVCGGWLLKTLVPMDAFEVNVMSESQALLYDDIMDKLNHTIVSYRGQNAIQKAAAFYLGCLNIEMRNTKGIKPLLDLLQRNGIVRWPMVQSQLSLDVFKVLGDFVREVGLNAIISVRVGIDQTDNNKHILYLGRPAFGVERVVLRGRYRSPFFRILHRYKLYMYRTALILGATVAAADLINEIAAFEGRLAAAVTDAAAASNPGKEFRTITLESLETAIPLVHWTNFLNNILTDTQMTLDLNDKVVVTHQEYLRRMAQIIKEEPV